MHNIGFATGHFQIPRGVKQGDPHVLAMRIRGEETMPSISVGGKEIKLENFQMIYQDS